MTQDVVVMAQRWWIHLNFKCSWWTPMAGRLRCGCFTTLSVVIGLLPLDDVHLMARNGRRVDHRVLVCWLAVASVSTKFPNSRSTIRWYLQVFRKRNWSLRKVQRFEEVICLASVSEHVDNEGCLWTAAQRDKDSQRFMAQEER